MRKFFVTLMTSLLGCSTAFAFFPEAVDSSLELGVGYRNDQIKWKTSARTFLFDGYTTTDDTSSSSGIPARFRSHLDWRRLNIWQIEARGTYVTCDNLYLRGYADYGWITSGRVRDRDNLLFDSSYESFDVISGYDSSSSRRRGHSRHGHVYDASIALGYQFKLCDDSFALSPLVGYSWHGQHLEFRRRHRGFFDSSSYYTSSSSYYSDYSSSSSSSGRREHGRYRTRWNSPFIGIDADYRFCCDWSLNASYEFHWARYHASGHWNLREDFIGSESPGHFRHHARNAHGQIARVGVKWDFCDCWTLGVRGDFQWWCTRHGKDRIKAFETSNGSVDEECFVAIPLRRVRWYSSAVMVDIGMVF